jgi:hypothetical protein
VTQPIRLVLPDLFQDRLPKLTEHAAHPNMIIGAVAQHDLRVAAVTRWLQWQPVRVLEPVDRTLDASKQGRLVRDCSCPLASWLFAHRATLRHRACGNPRDISYSIRHLAILYGSVLPDALMRRCADAASRPMKPQWSAPTT